MRIKYDGSNFRNLEQANSLEELRELLKDQAVDTMSASGHPITAAAHFAIKGDHQRVEWLRQLGANVNEIVLGYAAVGNNEWVDIYYDEYGVKVDVIALGYAWAGNDQEVRKYRDEYEANVDFIAMGYALAGEDLQVEKYRKEYDANVTRIAMGYALAGNDEKVEDYIGEHKADAKIIGMYYALHARNDSDSIAKVEQYRKKYNADSSLIARGYAATGNHTQVEKYRKKYGAAINQIVFGYVNTRNYSKVEQCHKEYGADVNKIAFYYAQTGQDKKAHEYHEKYNVPLSTIASGYAMEDPKKGILYILDNYLEDRKKICDSSGNTKDYFYSFFPFQKSFKQKEDAVNALKDALEGKTVNLSEHLATLRNGKLGRELRAFIKLGNANQLVDNEVNTITDFVNALQEKMTTPTAAI